MLSYRENRLFIITLIIIALNLLYYFICKPLCKEYARLNRQIDVKCIQLARNLMIIKEKDGAIGELSKYSTWLSLKGSQEERMASVLGEIEKLGKASGIYLNEVKPQGMKVMNLHETALVEIKFQTTINNLIKFIYGLENSLYFLQVDRLQLNCISGNQSPLLEGSIIISRLLFYS